MVSRQPEFEPIGEDDEPGLSQARFDDGAVGASSRTLTISPGESKDRGGPGSTALEIGGQG